MPSPTAWQTKRLLIRRLVAEDLEGLYELESDPEATRFIGGQWTRERTQEMLAHIIDNYAETDLEWHAVIESGSREFLGVCWLAPLAKPFCDALGVKCAVELGYRFIRRHWGKGYATEASAAFLRRGFIDLALDEIVAVVDPRNTASEHVLAKLGMNYRKTFLLEARPINFYNLTRAEYLAASVQSASASISS